MKKRDTEVGQKVLRKNPNEWCWNLFHFGELLELDVEIAAKTYRDDTYTHTHIHLDTHIALLQFPGVGIHFFLGH